MVSGTAAQPAVAASDLYKKNPLTGPVLEQIRFWEQAEADELKYGGELERGDAGNKGKTDAYPRMLVPILEIANDLEKVRQLVTTTSAGGAGGDGNGDAKFQAFRQARTILQKPAYEKVQFKKIFNRYGDNLYLGGGATPKTEQSLAYLLRNEILTAVEYMQAELDYLLKEPSESTDDLVALITTATTAMQRYLDVVPPRELEKAKELLVAHGS